MIRQPNDHALQSIAYSIVQGHAALNILEIDRTQGSRGSHPIVQEGITNFTISGE